MRLYIIKQLCAGCGTCVKTCPSIFQKNEMGKSNVTEDVVPHQYITQVEKAIKSCPSNAILSD